MPRKRMLLTLTALAATVVLAAVAGSGTAAPNRAAAPTKAKQIYWWIAINVAHPFYVQGKQGWDAAGKKYGVEARFIGPQTPDAQQQLTMIQQAVANPNTGGILIYPADPVAVAPALKEAMAKGIAVVAGNGDVPDKSERNAFVGTDNKKLGAAAADLVAKALGAKGGKVGIVSFISQLTHKHRVQGFQARIKAKYPKIKVIGIAPEDGTPQQEANAAGAFLQAHPDVNLLWTTDAGSGIVADQIKQQGKSGKVLAVGTDRTTEQLDAIRDGRVYATIVQDTYNEEFISLKYLYQLHNKLVKKLPDTTITKAVVITKANVGKMK